MPLADLLNLNGKPENLLWPANREVEIVVQPDGTVESAWWTPEILVLLCGICGMQNTTACITCVNKNPWCG